MDKSILDLLQEKEKEDRNRKRGKGWQLNIEEIRDRAWERMKHCSFNELLEANEGNEG